jgi:hypothetical protein
VNGERDSGGDIELSEVALRWSAAAVDGSRHAVVMATRILTMITMMMMIAFMVLPRVLGFRVGRPSAERLRRSPGT